MKQFEIQTKSLRILERLQGLVDIGIELGLDLKSIQDKITSTKSALSSGIIRIALLGCFSDGKTSTIAGLLGRLEGNMKIDQDESSDELTIYRPEGLKEGFEIVDTPGLFGTKDKEKDGRLVKLSDETIQYLSEANIVVYLCDARTPLKDSHRETIKWVMRNLGKLDSSVFVLNKMDYVCDIEDEDEYGDSVCIKTKTFIDRLDNILNLTLKEKEELKICCISANPNGEGMESWFERGEEYLQVSHIGDLRKSISTIVDKTNVLDSQTSMVISSAKDVLSKLEKAIEAVSTPVNEALEHARESCEDLTYDVNNLETELARKKNETIDEINEYKRSLIMEVKGASVETIENVLDFNIGLDKGKVSYSLVTNKIKSIQENSMNCNSSFIADVETKFERKLNDQDEFIKGAIGKGVQALKGVKINNNQVLAVRNVLFKSHKFKPWGAVKTASNVTKGIGVAATGLGLVIEAYQWWKKYKSQKELEELKKSVLNDIDSIFSSLYDTFSDENYYKYYAPLFLEMQKALEERNAQIMELQKKVDDLNAFKGQTAGFIFSESEYVEFEEV